MTVPAGETTSLYVLVHVPTGAAPGHYDGTLDLDAAGIVPLAVEVAPVTANRDGYTIVARLNQIQLAKASGVSEDDPRFVRGVYDRLLPMLRAHGVSPGKPPHTAPKVNPATWALDYSDSPFGTARRTNLDAFFAMGFPAVEVPFLPNFPQAGGEDRAFSAEGRRRTAARDFAAAFAPVAGRTFALPVDEPNARTYAQLNRAAAQLASASPRIPVLATEAPHPEALKAIGTSVDIWAPPIWDLFKVPKGVATVRAKGKRVWWYTYGSDTQRYTPNVLIDKPTTEPRVMGWLAAKEGVEGFYYWGLNNWGGDAYHSPFDDPWYLSHTRAADTCGRGGEVGGNGEASLIYPTGDPSDPAIGSLRLEALRDGAEDNSLLRALQGADPAFYAQVMEGVSTPYTGRSEGGRTTGCSDDGRPAYLPVVETDPAAVDGARRAVLARLSATPLPTLQGTVVYGPALKGRSRRTTSRAFALAGAPVEGAVVRFGAFSTVTDAKGRWTLADVSPVPGTLTVSRDPVGRVNATSVAIDAATLAQPGAIRVSTPPMPLWPSDAVIRPGGLTRFSGRIAPARARTRGQAVTMTIGRRYHANGDEVVYPGNVSPSVDSFYPTGKGGRAAAPLRNWSRYRFLEFTATVLRRPPTDQAFHLIVTPGGPLPQREQGGRGQPHPAGAAEPVRHARDDQRALPAVRRPERGAEALARQPRPEGHPPRRRHAPRALGGALRGPVPLLELRAEPPGREAQQPEVEEAPLLGRPVADVHAGDGHRAVNGQHLGREVPALGRIALDRPPARDGVAAPQRLGARARAVEGVGREEGVDAAGAPLPPRRLVRGDPAGDALAVHRGQRRRTALIARSASRRASRSAMERRLS